jgi:hypothetical protein
MAATLDGLVKETGAVFEAKFMLPWSFSEEGSAEKHMAQLQHNMLVAGTKKSVLSIINGGGKWIEITIEADPIYQTILIAAEKGFRHRQGAGLGGNTNTQSESNGLSLARTSSSIPAGALHMKTRSTLLPRGASQFVSFNDLPAPDDALVCGQHKTTA